MASREHITTMIENTETLLESLSSNYRPSYKIEGQEVKHAEYQSLLEARLSKYSKMLEDLDNKEEIFEFKVEARS